MRNPLSNLDLKWQLVDQRQFGMLSTYVPAYTNKQRYSQALLFSECSKKDCSQQMAIHCWGWLGNPPTWTSNGSFKYLICDNDDTYVPTILIHASAGSATQLNLSNRVSTSKLMGCWIFIKGSLVIKCQWGSHQVHPPRLLSNDKWRLKNIQNIYLTSRLLPKRLACDFDSLLSEFLCFNFNFKLTLLIV